MDRAHVPSEMANINVIAACRAVIQYSPTDAKAHCELGDALDRTGDIDGAIAAYREVVRLAPKRLKAYYCLGAALRKKGDIDGAVAAFHRAIWLRAKHAQVREKFGVAFPTKGDIDLAIAACREAVRLQPHDAGAHYVLGIALSMGHDISSALAAYREAVRLGRVLSTNRLPLPAESIVPSPREGFVCCIYCGAEVRLARITRHRRKCNANTGGKLEKKRRQISGIGGVVVKIARRRGPRPERVRIDSPLGHEPSDDF